MNGVSVRSIPLPCAEGPLKPAVDGRGLQIPDQIESREEARAAYAQLVSTEAMRTESGHQLTRWERAALKALRRYRDVRTPTAPHEFTAIARNRLRQRSKAAKRARAAQRTVEGHRRSLAALAAVAGGTD
ncbi:MAG: hypothetical protein KF709_02775 [Gemmatimonadaceae bacterium]|nr:hypothetical protein [Gemmatimonadaceae bacterium]